ncbi:MAG: T9SS type A sorting domain-containing protein [Phaeodactylibacter sp.]|nr:T9SS type A sorting domain-containing protein [Phaeodactylibacter sp.]MCB9265188.1 T9SS type A sorting domain-containing protein [Lewinellaceae bacterium]MCB9285950.1 T9SS type A sorting domain-containing protein [Lewinellaceae bacterium]
MKMHLTILTIFSIVIAALHTSSAQTQIGETIEGLEIGDGFGYSVSLSSDGTRLAIGMPYIDPEPIGGFEGMVQVFDLIDGNWEKAGPDIICPDCGEGNREFGSSVSLSSDGNRLAIGNNTEPGYSVVIVLEWNGTGWDELGRFDGFENAYGYGSSISASSDCIRIAAATSGHGADVNELMLTNEVPFEIYSRIGQKLDRPEFNDYGRSVSISADGSRVAVGGEDVYGLGQVDVYDYDENGMWVQVGGFTADNQDDFTGIAGTISLSADGNRLAVGSPGFGDHIDSQRIKVYEWDGASWNQLGSTILGDAFGSPVSLSPDGKRLATTAIRDEVSTQVQVFEWNGESWAPFGNNISGGRDYEYFGGSLSFSADGNRLAIGAFSEEGGPAGRVLVYDFTTISAIQEAPVENEFKVFPNPTSGQVELTGADSGQACVMDVIGQTLFCSNVAQSTIDLTCLPGGVYFIQAYSGGKLVTRKVVKE